MTPLRLRLYITGRTAQSRRAVENLHQICESHLRGRCEVEIIDILENPGIAEAEKILVTPTLVKRSPEPAFKICGDLSDFGKVVAGIELGHTDRELPS